MFRGKTRSTKANRRDRDKHPHRARKRETKHRGKTRQNRNRARHFRIGARHFTRRARRVGASGSSTPPYRIARRGGSGRRHDARARRVRWARHFASLKLGGSELRRVAPLARRLRPAAVGAAPLIDTATRRPLVGGYGKRPPLERGKETNRNGRRLKRGVSLKQRKPRMPGGGCGLSAVAFCLSCCCFCLT